MVTVVLIIDGCIDNRINERDWQRGWVGPIYTQFIYIYYVKVGKLGFCECGFSNLLALKIYILMRGDLIKTKVMDKGHQYFLLLTIFSLCIKNAVIKKRDPFYALK